MKLPYQPTGEWDLEKIKDLPIKPKLVIDLGSGDGRVLKIFMEAFNCEVIGYETNLELAQQCGLMALTSISDMWEADVSQADAVYIFWMPELMQRFKDEIMSKMKQGSYVVSHLFPIPDLKAIQIIGTLYCYQNI